MRVLVTGNTGYIIRSHTYVALLEAGHDITPIDNHCDSSPIALERDQEVTDKPLIFISGEIPNSKGLGRALAGEVGAIIHFATLKAAGEGYEKPLELRKQHRRREEGLLATCEAMWQGQSANRDGHVTVGRDPET